MLMMRKWIFYLATGDDKGREECWNLTEALREIIPDADVEWESVKNDYGMLTITIEKEHAE